MKDFIIAALPWVIFGTAIAVYCAAFAASKKKKSKKENGKRKSESYSGMGIAIGMCFGVLIGCLTDNLGLWIPIGLWVGMILDVFYK